MYNMNKSRLQISTENINLLGAKYRTCEYSSRFYIKKKDIMINQVLKKGGQYVKVFVCNTKYS